MKVNEFLNALCETLNRPPDSLSLDDTAATVEEWDSMGHLAIIATIDYKLHVSVNDAQLRNFSSIRELVDRLKARKVLED